MDNKEFDAYFHNSIFNRWSKNFWDDGRIIHPIIGEIYLERGWHMGSPPSIEMKFYCLDLTPARNPYNI